MYKVRVGVPHGGSFRLPLLEDVFGGDNSGPQLAANNETGQHFKDHNSTTFYTDDNSRYTDYYHSTAGIGSSLPDFVDINGTACELDNPENTTCYAKPV